MDEDDYALKFSVTHFATHHDTEAFVSTAMPLECCMTKVELATTSTLL